MSLYPQHLLDVHDELICDVFAGGGGASSGIEQAFGRMVDVAINHDAKALSMHQANHPQTLHIQSDIFEVDPREVCKGRPVGFAWFSPDCTDHSKAKGGKPIRTTKRRSLAWVVTRWAGTVRPRVIMLENVEEFKEWSPLIGLPGKYRRCPKRKGLRFRQWVKSLRRLGYKVEWRELRACDYGAPTIRKRLFVIARRDGQPIVWPEPTHGPKRDKPYRTAAECIDWSIPMLSIFATKEEAKEWGKANNRPSPIRPLADNTNKRIARGVKRFVLDNPKPFLVTLAHGESAPNGSKRWGKTERDIDQPMTTVKCSGGDAVVAPLISPITHEGDRKTPPANEPLATITTANRGEQALIAAHMTTFRSGATGHELDEPTKTVTANSHDAKSNPGGCAPMGIVAANLATYYGDKGDSEPRGAMLDDPVHTIPTENRHALVASFLAQNNEGFYEGAGRGLDEPNPTVCANGSSQSLVTAFCNVNRNNGSDGYGLDKGADTITAEGAYHNVVAAHIQRDFGTSTGHKADQPIGCLTSEGGGKAGLVASFLSKFYGEGTGQSLGEPVHTIPTVDRFGLVTVKIGDQTFYIEDIAMRMLQPHELYAAQGFRPGYIHDRGIDGKPFTKTEQVRMCGNSVSPPVAEALARANCPELVARTQGRRAA